MQSNMQRTRVCGMLISKWDVCITPLPKGSGINVEEDTGKVSEPQGVNVCGKILLARHSTVAHMNSQLGLCVPGLYKIRLTKSHCGWRRSSMSHRGAFGGQCVLGEGGVLLFRYAISERLSGLQ